MSKALYTKGPLGKCTHCKAKIWKTSYVSKTGLANGLTDCVVVETLTHYLIEGLVKAVTLLSKLHKQDRSQ